MRLTKTDIICLKAVYYYKGTWGNDAKCDLEIRDTFFGKQVIITQTCLVQTSITNMFERLATMIYRDFLLGYPVEKIEWYENYAIYFSGEPSLFQTAKVSLTWENGKFHTPRWKKGVTTAICDGIARFTTASQQLPLVFEVKETIKRLFKFSSNKAN